MRALFALSNDLALFLLPFPIVLEGEKESPRNRTFLPI